MTSADLPGRTTNGLASGATGGSFHHPRRRRQHRDYHTIAKVDFDSLYGRIRFNATGQINLPQTVVQIQKSKLVAIYGPKGLLEKALYPMPEWGKR